MRRIGAAAPNSCTVPMNCCYAPMSMSFHLPMRNLVQGCKGTDDMSRPNGSQIAEGYVDDGCR